MYLAAIYMYMYFLSARRKYIAVVNFQSVEIMIAEKKNDKEYRI